MEPPTQGNPEGALPRDFFLLLILTRIRERGWPKSKGLLSRRRVISEVAIVESMRDAVRTALTIGSSIPQAAQSLAILYGPYPTQRAVNAAIDAFVEVGEFKMRWNPPIDPKWLQFCRVGFDRPGQATLIDWSPTAHEFNFDDPVVGEMLAEARTNAMIAMAWGLRHPDDCVQLFHVESAENEQYSTVFLSRRMESAFDAQDIYDGWLHWAQDLVSRYETAIELPSLPRLPK